MARKRLSTAIPRDWTPEAAEIIQAEFERIYSQLEPLPEGIGGIPTPTPGSILYGDQAGTNGWILLPIDTTAQRVIGNDTGVPSWVQVDLTLGVTGTLPATHGGTGTATVAVGDLLYGSAVNTWSKLAKSATATRYLSNTGASNVPAWAQVDLTNGVTGTLPATSGGTGTSTTTQGDLLYGAAGNTWAKLAKNTSATRYLSNTGTSNDPAWAQVALATGVSGTLPDGNLSTNVPLLNAASNTFTGDLILANNKYLKGTDFGASSTRRLIGENTSTQISIDPDAYGVYFGGSITLLGSGSASGSHFYATLVAADDPQFRATATETLFGMAAYYNGSSPTHAGIVVDKYAELWAETYPFGGASTGPAGLLIGISTNAPVIFASNNTPIAKITSAGLLAYTDATFDIGASGATRFRDFFLSRNAAIGGLLDLSGASAGQIKFPATQNASSNANTFDDYEEGNWTPADASGAGLSLTITSATYIKKGKEVTAIMNVVYPVTASGAAAKVSGLPFTTDTNLAVAVGFTDSGIAVYANIPVSGTTMEFYTSAAAAVTNLQLSLAKVRVVIVYQATA